MATPDHDTQRRILNRLRRAHGQLGAVIAAVEEDRSCRDIVTQLAAVSAALDRAGFAIISRAMQDCLTDPAAAKREENLTTDEVEKLFLSLA